VTNMLPHTKIRCYFRVLTDTTLTEFPGSTLRSLLITGLRNVCCHDRGLTCEHCLLNHHCIFPYLTRHQTSTGEDTVQPYLISCPEVASFYKKGDTFFFDMVLVGEKANTLFPYIAYSLSEWDKMRLDNFQYLLENRINHTYGKIDVRQINAPHGRLNLIKIEQINSGGQPLSLFSSDTNKITPPRLTHFVFNSLQTVASPNATIRFISPCRMERKIPDPRTGIKGKKKLILPELFSLEIFVQSLKTRYMALMDQFAADASDSSVGHPLEIIKLYVDDTTRLVTNNLKSINVLRVHPKSGKWKHCDGFTGTICLTNLHPYTMQLMEFAAIMHLGKFATYGYGEIEITQ